jgi:hypothetical protein
MRQHKNSQNSHPAQKEKKGIAESLTPFSFLFTTFSVSLHLSCTQNFYVSPPLAASSRLSLMRRFKA